MTFSIGLKINKKKKIKVLGIMQTPVCFVVVYYTAVLMRDDQSCTVKRWIQLGQLSFLRDSAGRRICNR